MFDVCGRLGVGVTISTIVTPIIKPGISWEMILISFTVGAILIVLGLMKGVFELDVSKNKEV